MEELQMQIAVLAFDGCLGSSVLGPVDMLTLARKMISKRGQPEPYSVSTVSFDGCPVEDGTGRRLDVDASFDEIGECAAILVPGYFCELGHSFPATPAIGAAAAWIRPCLSGCHPQPLHVEYEDGYSAAQRPFVSGVASRVPTTFPGRQGLCRLSGEGAVA
jgi:transcriptional regulator GlxA family with amidase domain